MHEPDRPIPMTSVMWVRNIVDALTESGLDGMALSNDAGIPSAVYGISDAGVPAQNIARLWDLAMTASGKPDIGLIASGHFRPASLDAVGYLMMSSDVLLEAVQRGVRFHGAHSSATHTSLTQLDDGYRLEFHIMDGIVDVQRQNHDFITSCVLKFFRFMTGQDLKPMRAEFLYPAPEDQKPHAQVFQCPLAFGAARTALHFNNAALARPVITANPLLVAMHEHAATRRIQQFGQSQTTQWVRQLIVQALPDGEPSRERVAASMVISPRNLQRQLSVEGTSFSKLLDEIRRNLSDHYLANARLALTDIAYLLGFSEQSTYTRAAKRWYGKAPNKIRAGLLQGDISNPA